MAVKAPALAPLPGLPTKVTVYEVGARDGLQNEKGLVPVEVKAEFVRQLLAAGLTALIGIGAVLHIGVSLAVLPATGVTLPFVSYGRSSLLVSLIATGMLISVGQRRTGRAAGE